MHIELLIGDITEVQADAIVNAANSSLLGGGGVDGAIHRKGGPAILEECLLIREKQGGCRTGEAIYTTAGKLPAKYVIHTVGPVWKGGFHDEDRLLRNCYINSLQIAVNQGLRTVAFPNISTGAYRFPRQRAAGIAVEAVREFQSSTPKSPQVIFVCFDEENYNLYRTLLY